MNVNDLIKTFKAFMTKIRIPKNFSGYLCNYTNK